MKRKTTRAATAAARSRGNNDDDDDDNNDRETASWSELMSFVFGCGPGIKIIFAVGMVGAVLDGLVYPLNAYLFSLIISQLSGTSTNGMQAVQGTAILFVFAGTISVGAACIHTASLHIVGFHASKAFRLHWVEALLRHDASFFDVHDVGGLATQISSTVKAYRQGIAEKLGNCVKYAFVGIGSMGFALVSSWRVTLAVLTILPIVAVASMALVHYNQTTGQRAAMAYQKAASIAYSSVANIRTVHSLNAVPEMIRKYASATDEAYRKMTSYLVKIGVAKGSVQGSFLLMYIVLTMYGSHLLYSELAETGCDPSGNVHDNQSCSQTGQELFNALVGVAFAGLGLAQFAACLEGITQARVAAYQALATINRKPGAAMQVIYHKDSRAVAAAATTPSGKVEPNELEPNDTDSSSSSTRNKNEFWADEEDCGNDVRHDKNVKAILPKYEINSTCKGGLKPKHVEGSISIKNVYFSYPTRPGVNVFEGLSTEIKAGSTVAFVGPSGGGKSTVVSMIERFYDPRSGFIEIDGVNIKDINVAHLRGLIGYVGQEPTLFSTTIRQNILYGNPSATQEQIEAAARLASAHDFIMDFAEGYDTQVGYRGGRLSGGQRQRIAIARALVRKPKILLLDEATSALDAESERLVQNALDNILKQEKITTIIIAHRLSTIRNVDKINVIVAGSVVEQGTHDELMSTQSYYRKLVEEQDGSVVKKDEPSSAKARTRTRTRTLYVEKVATGIEIAKDVTHIFFNNVTFAYPTRSQRNVLSGFTLRIRRGETIALVGDSGGGKSTTVGLIERFYDPQQGSVEYMGKNIKSLNVRWYRDQLAYVGQEPALFSGSIARNIAYAAPNASWADIEEACRQANAHDFIMEFPEGYDTPVGEHGGQLSGGQKQRIALARALIRKPKVLILDEITAALDNESEAIVQTAIDKLTESRKHTVIMISHRLSTVRNSDRIAFVADGQVLECGSHEELLRNARSRYKRLLESSKRESCTAASSTFQCRVGPNNYGDDKHQDSWEAVVVAGSTAGESDSLEMALLREGNRQSAQEQQGSEQIPLCVIKRRARAMAKPDCMFMFVGVIGAVLVGAIWPMLGVLFSQMIALLFYRVEACPTDDGRIPEGFEYCEDYWLQTAKEMQEMSYTISMFWAIMIAAAMFGQVVLSWGFGMASERLSKRTRDSTFTALLRQEMSFFDMHEVGSLTSQLQEDAARVYIFLGAPLRAITVSVASVCTGVLLSFIFMWPLAIVTLLCLPLLGCTLMIELSKLLGAQEGSGDIADLVNSDNPDSIIVETLLNIRTVAIFTLETTRLEDYKDALLHRPSSEASRYKHDALVQGVKSGMTLLIQMWVNGLQLWFGGYLMYNYPDLFTFQDFVISFFAVPFSLMGLKAVADSMSLSDKKASEESVGRIIQLLDRKSAIDPLAEDEGMTKC